MCHEPPNPSPPLSPNAWNTDIQFNLKQLLCVPFKPRAVSPAHEPEFNFRFTTWFIILKQFCISELFTTDEDLAMHVSRGKEARRTESLNSGTASHIPNKQIIAFRVMPGHPGNPVHFFFRWNRIPSIPCSTAEICLEMNCITKQKTKQKNHSSCLCW